MDHKYSNSNSIFGIYIHELAFILIFKAFAHFSSRVIDIGKSVPLLSLMAQVAETHIDICISSEISYHNFQLLAIMKIRYFKLSCSHFHVSICVSATCAICDTSSTDLPMSITLLENV